MQNYYTKSLSAQRLKRCYSIAPERVQRYLKAEIEFVRKRIRPSSKILELGCGYGRVIKEISSETDFIFGVNTSLSSLQLALETFENHSTCSFIAMDAVQLGFIDNSFDMVFCIQNGICAFAIDQTQLIIEAMRITKKGGTVLFSTYAEQFWPHRLQWFEKQSQYGLIGKLDYNATKNGIIVCKDGFSSGTLSIGYFDKSISNLNLDVRITLVDNSSMFYEITV